MAKAASPDTLMEEIRRQARDLFETAGHCQELLSNLAHADVAFDLPLAEEAARQQQLGEQKKGLEDNLARFLRNLDLWSLQLDADFDALDVPTFWEKLGGSLFRRKAAGQPSGTRHSRLLAQFFDLLRMSDAIAELLIANRDRFRALHAQGEMALLAIVERQRRIIDTTDIAQIRIVEIQRLLRGLNMRLSERTSPAAMQRLGGEREELTSELNALSQREKALLAESGTFDAGISLFQLFVDTSNDAVAAHNTLINKTMAEAEHRITTAAAVHEAVTGKTIRLDPTVYRSLAPIIEKFSLGILAAPDIPRRRHVTEEAFARRFTVEPLPSP